ncbi:prolyl-tRNA synthetase [Candidatus Falkowbacteria bacterium CG10_big_fil_rev_8_21_14_0_10_37_14]|uniref:Proline--tRNA ligase n=1 Tax=Candidatus Falkowbacteria bacterium CG10_big_fil_rev_8_21_14_0_10_37_14 TaxID=1974561 RepID=A0A2M6WT17_9BACT|nr:prolyl-tRNA synthetase [Candidatus Falkowbacteria bacterium]PIT95937.1 MAG: prolyl-tRNA synthetase [Candidatus Falkowbacteria bacterium CG10_big_fil_rev_8_21_14_0_10_37_14]
MRLSQLFTRTLKENPKDETSLNAQILMRAGFIDKIGAGIYTFLPLGLRVHNNICRVIREEIDAIGGQEILMPALTPKEYWQITGRWENFDALFRLKGGDNRDYALGATHEEIVTPTVQRHVFSYKDLSTAVYQIQTKFRNELRSKAGLLRGREFSMKDLYSFHTDQKTLDAYYEIAQKAYFKIYERLGLLDITFLTYASGGAFSKYSHEFQTVCDAGEDTIHICDKCKVAVNQEIIEEQSACPLCGNVELRAEKAIEVGNIFKLGTRFSEPFGFNYLDESGTEKPVIMGCYGMGPSRIMGTIVEISHDDGGLIWPEEVAPFKVHLVSLRQNEATDLLYDRLQKAKIEVIYDDRDLGAGEKLVSADLMGCPYRVVVSAKTLAEGSVEIKKRTSQEVELVKLGELINYWTK